ncbi:class I SAM-dependent methyltransferase [Nonomuraea sp. NEAU-A123]|uniref:class I SAM-dependent methyltransferase n=1 Tax=Nonomuraea sp. NEAU-A123 TaxID=2839649 RepID=UPI001BE4D9A2|nr:class I SAM-dependent methyltransferase [Nonomuraea sp. NEAU-A123]MBT2227741.1 methyltransferase [Nonomuraea sp. NEAU-A123]
MAHADMIMSSRSFLEYRAMFALDERDLDGVLLDCAGGASGFVAEAGAMGVRALAADPLYAHGAAVLAERLSADLEQGNAMISANADRFVWEWYGSAERRRELRLRARSAFIADIHRRPGAYLAARLPHLPLADGSADLVLCSHLLFTWADRLDQEWHRAAIMEMSRVSRREVRIFPLVRMGDGEPVPFLDTLRADLRAEGLACAVREVPYEFQRGARHMLTVAKRR